jgi:hypothetical protein
MQSEQTIERPESTSQRAAAGRSEARVLALWLAGYLLYRVLLPLVPLPAGRPSPVVLLLLMAVSAFAGIGIPIGLIAALIRTVKRVPVYVWIAVGGALVWVGLLFLGVRLGRSLPRTVWPLMSGIQDGAMILAVASVGAALATLLREPNILVPAGIFAAFADFVVVNFGTVHKALSTQKGQAVVQAVSAKLPSVGQGIPPLTVGPADFLFLGFFLCCATRFGWSLEGNARALTLVLAISLILVPIIGAVPALAPMSIAFMAINWKRFRLTRDELIGSAAVLGVTGALFLGYFLFVFGRHR